jgi:Cof subfamily protein (haloacid dehalogenase superfamily)
MPLSETLPIIAFDLDGTLLTPQGEIHPHDIELLTMEDPPAIFIPTTGRSLFAIRKMFQTFGIIKDVPLPFHLILQNGSAIYDCDENILRYTPFDLALQNGLIPLFKTCPEVTFLLFSNNRLFLLNPTPYGVARTLRYLFTPEPYNDHEPPPPCSKIICMTENPEDLTKVREMVSRFGVEATLSLPTVLELNPPGVNKGAGLEFLAEVNGWEKSRVYCAGDGENDVEMFRRFSTTFTPKTSPATIQALATHIIDTSVDGLLTSMVNIIRHEKN